MATKHDMPTHAAEDATMTPSKKAKTVANEIDLATAETTPDTLRMLAQGVWSYVTPFVFVHGEWSIPMFNRAIVVYIKSQDALAIINPSEMKGDVKQQLHDLEAELDASVKYLISSGDWHWMFLEEHLKTFPNAKAYVAPGRVPDKKPGFPFTVLDYSKETVLEELAPELEVFPLKGMRNSEDGTDDDRHDFVFYLKNAHAIANADTFFYYAPGVNGLTDVLKSMGLVEGPIQWHFQGKAVVADYKVLIESLETIIKKCEFDSYVSLHGPPGNVKKSGAKDEIVALISKLEAWSTEPTEPAATAPKAD